MQWLQADRAKMRRKLHPATRLHFTPTTTSIKRAISTPPADAESLPFPSSLCSSVASILVLGLCSAVPCKIHGRAAEPPSPTSPVPFSLASERASAGRAPSDLT